MEIKEFSQTENKDYWIGKIAQADWSAGKYLGQILRDGSFYYLCGSKAKVFLLTEGNELLSFCSYAEIDDVPDTSLKPWIGFEFFQEMQDRRGDMSLVYKRALRAVKAR